MCVIYNQRGIIVVNNKVDVELCCSGLMAVVYD